MSSRVYSYINNSSYSLSGGSNCRNSSNRRNTRDFGHTRRGRNRSLLIIFGIVFVITSVIVTGRAYAGNFSDSTESDAVKMYKSVMVYSGDTLESLAVKYMGDEYSSEIKYINEIAAINGLCADASLTPGNCIIIPYYTNSALYSDTVDINDNSIDFYVSF